MPSAADAPAIHHEAVSVANTSTGSKAIHITGHTGFMPFPIDSRAAVETTAARAASRGCLRTKSMKISPEGTLIKLPKFLCRETDAAAEIQHDQPMRNRTHLECDLHGIIATQFAGLHRLFQHSHRGIERRRTAGNKIPRILPRTLARGKKHQVIQVRRPERSVQKNISDQ